MFEVASPSAPLPPIPNLSIPQFTLDYFEHLNRPTLNKNTPWFIEDATGRAIYLDEVKSRTFGLANVLSLKYGIKVDDVVCLFSRNHVDYAVAIWATHRLGGVISGANPGYTAAELQYQLEISKASFIIAHPDSYNTTLAAAKAAGIPHDRVVFFNTGKTFPGFLTVEDLVKEGSSHKASFVEPKIDARTKLAFMSFSSGTTGKPKAVAIPHISVITNVIQFAAHNKVNENYVGPEDQRYRAGDVAIAVLPFYHIYGLVLNLHFMLFAGMTIVVVPQFNFVEMLKSIGRYRISHLMLVPPQVVLLCKHPEVPKYDLSSVRLIMTGAAPLSHEVQKQVIDLLPNAHIGQAYGMTETCTAVSAFPVGQKRGQPGSSGQLLPGCTARVVKPDGSFAGYDEPGELVIYSPSNALCYYNNEQATRETFLDGGWVRTGDEVKVDRNAELWVLDRMKEIMKVRGFQVAPAELEGCILDHEYVSDACVVGVPDDFSGEVPLAFVVLSEAAKKEGASDNDIKASIVKHVADNKIAYKRLAGGVEFVSAIPKNPSGKLLRRVLRDQAKQLRKNAPTKAKL